jgi:hypothetical protein
VDTGRLRRFWVKTNDSRTRDAHRAVPDMNPEGVGMDEPYRTPLGPLMFPRDPNGSGANTIQCRCAERYALADAPAPASGTRARRKPAPKPKAEPEGRAPKTPAELRAEYERLRGEAAAFDAAGSTNYSPEAMRARRDASAARVAWARALPPEELRAAKAEVYREMVRAPKNFDLTKYEGRFREASGWVPYDVLEEMRFKGYTVNIKNAKRSKFRAYADNKHSYIAMDDDGWVFAHEYAHQIDAFFGGGKLDRGSWTNKDFVGASAKAREGYKGIFRKHRAETKGVYRNGDGEYWRDNWIDDYEGRIYKRRDGVSDGLEFWSMNCQRYAGYRHALAEGSGEASAALISRWGAVKRRYPDMADLIERLFGGDFARGI